MKSRSDSVTRRATLLCGAQSGNVVAAAAADGGREAGRESTEQQCHEEPIERVSHRLTRLVDGGEIAFVNVSDARVRFGVIQTGHSGDETRDVVAIVGRK